MTVFVTRRLADEYLSAPFPHVGRHLLTAPTGLILTDVEIADANRGDGIDVVIVSTTIEGPAGERPPILGRLIAVSWRSIEATGSPGSSTNCSVTTISPTFAPPSRS
jgi:hypothetical protein